MKNYLPVLLTAIVFCSCRPTALVFISVQQPAPVTLPPNIKSVAVVNRSEASEQAKVVDVADKIFSLEGKNLDRDGAREGITGLSDELMKNNRFTEVKAPPIADLRTNTPGRFPAPLSWETVGKICADNNADALFVLELFDTDSKISYSVNNTTISTPLGRVPALEHQANMVTIVRTGWRIYDPAGRNILDEYILSKRLNFTGKGINPVIAAAALIDRKEAVKQAGNNAGHGYAFRIIPYWIRVSREYYTKGTDNFVVARRKSQTGNWDGAGELWLRETTNPNSNIAGRACYNMAIISEINGDLDKAIQWAQKAYENNNNRLALGYIRLLQDRKANSAVLQEQQPEGAGGQ